MDRLEKKEVIARVIGNYVGLQESFNTLNKAIGDTTGGPFFDRMWRMFDEYMASAETLIGDKEKWLGWFVYDNSCGASELKAGLGRRLKKIKTVDDLLDLIEETK